MSGAPRSSPPWTPSPPASSPVSRSPSRSAPSACSSSTSASAAASGPPSWPAWAPRWPTASTRPSPRSRASPSARGSPPPSARSRSSRPPRSPPSASTGCSRCGARPAERAVPPADHRLVARFVALTAVNPTTAATFAAVTVGLPAVAHASAPGKAAFVAGRLRRLARLAEHARRRRRPHAPRPAGERADVDVGRRPAAGAGAGAAVGARGLSLLLARPLAAVRGDLRTASSREGCVPGRGARGRPRRDTGGLDFPRKPTTPRTVSTTPRARGRRPRAP